MLILNKFQYQNKHSFRKTCLKYFAGYVNHDDVRLPKLNGNVKYFERTRYSKLMLEEKHKRILENIAQYGVKLKILLENILTFTTSYKDVIKTDSHNKGLPPEKTQAIAQTIITPNLVFKSRENYYPQSFLEKCKHKIEEDIIKRCM